LVAAWCGIQNAVRRGIASCQRHADGRALPLWPSLSRRLFACGLLACGWSLRAQAQPSAPGLAALGLPTDGIQIELDPLSDTGNAIPLGLRITAPAGLRITGFEIVAPDNPVPRVLQLRLSTPVPEYRFATRIRLNGSQAVWVLARFSDGSRHAASAATVVTSSACFDGT